MCTSCSGKVELGVPYCASCAQSTDHKSPSVAPLMSSSEGTEGDDRRISERTALLSPEPRARSRMGPYLSRLVGAVLLLGVAVGGVVVGRNQIDARDAAIAVQQQQIADLTGATLAVQDELSAVRSDRDRLTNELTNRTQERDGLQVDRDNLAAELAMAHQQVSDTQSALSEANKQLNQARQSGADQQQRATSADARSTSITAVLKLDDQIHTEYGSLLQEITNMNQGVNRLDYFSAAAAYARAQTVADRLTRLFDQRKSALAVL